FMTGTFISSTFYMDNLPDWVNKFNEKDEMMRYIGKEWNTFFDISTYTESGPDNSPYEVLLPGKKTPTFPYNLTEMSEGGLAPYLFTHTPFCNTFLTYFAISALDSEKMGKVNVTYFF